jgi:hypothetical protein
LAGLGALSASLSCAFARRLEATADVVARVIARTAVAEMRTK